MRAGTRPGPVDVEGRLTQWGLRAAVWAQLHPWWASVIVCVVTASSGTLAPRGANLVTDALGSELDFVLFFAVIAVALGLVLGGLVTLTRLTARGSDLIAKAVAWLVIVLGLPVLLVGGSQLSLPIDLSEWHTVTVVALCGLGLAVALLVAAWVIPFPITVRAIPRVLVGAAGCLGVFGAAAHLIDSALDAEHWILGTVITAVSLAFLLVAWVRLARFAGWVALAACVSTVVPHVVEFEAPSWTLWIYAALIIFVGALPTAAPSRLLDRVTAIPLDHAVHDGRVR